MGVGVKGENWATPAQDPDGITDPWKRGKDILEHVRGMRLKNPLVEDAISVRNYCLRS